MWNDRYGASGLSLAGRAAFDPLTLTAITLTATAAAGAMGAAGSIASGNAAQQAGQMQKTAADFQARQIDQNAGQSIASGQRQMFDTQEKTRLAISSATARGAASGIDVAVGSPATNTGEIAQRGSYHALMDMFNGQSAATGMANQATGVRYTGEMAKIGGDTAKQASYLAAGGQIAGAIGSGASRFGAIQYPTSSGRAGASF